MVRISGPVSVSVFELGDKKLFLFGDVHESKTGLCKEGKKKEKSIFITDFIDSFKSSPTEVFLESDWVPSKHKDVDILRIVLNQYKEEMYSSHDSKQIFKVHYTDIRSKESFLELSLSVQSILYFRINEYKKLFGKHPTEVILQYFPTLKTFNEFTDIIMKSDNYKKDMKQLLQDERLFAGSNVLASAPGDTKQKIHRIRKQLLKLSSTDYNKLISYHRETMREYYKEYKSKYDNIIKKIKVEKASQEDIQEIALIVLLYISHIMDMYALGRMIYYIRNTKSKTFISYTGAAHAANYAIFFYYFWNKEASLIHNEYAKEYKNGNFRRCVSIPKQLL